MLQAISYNAITVQVISKSIRDMQSYWSLNIQNIIRVSFKQQSFNVLQEKLKSIHWRLAEFYYNRGLQKPYTCTFTILQETVDGFLCPFIVFIESKTNN